ncbi:MAG TPA: dihydroorotate dehydrogenase [bacterium]|nr:dihydroorotate dehydrogenase [bacterium]HOG43299.1 dihydroorotate dehydrogenase [bacterium]HPV20164.1 dihydroorotate dehydrogenase [bacterium]HPY14437.1 dihydroorotate dehydrogenase [bacterium]HQM84651.1 dihydroorotate dehydrogenase [bacterium]
MDLSVKIGKMTLQNPILTASGTFGYGPEFSYYLDLNKIGGFCTKGISIEPRGGNPAPRIVETASGMLNSIGLENCGSEAFLTKVMPTIKNVKSAIIVNFYAGTEEDFIRLAEVLSVDERIDALEMNLSCPNVKKGGSAFGANPELIERLTRSIKNVTDKTLIVKLSPNVTDITTTALAAESGGADSVSLINTLIGTAIDREKRTFILGNKIGGLSGPAIKPVALRMVWQVAKAVKIPVIGMGGISTLEDVLDFLIVGAKAVQIGAWNFINPSIAEEVVEGLENYLKQRGETLAELTGSIKG